MTERDIVKVMQMTAGGPDSPPGDCYRACVCTILGLERDDLTSPSPELPYEEWNAAWQQQLGPLGLWQVGVEMERPTSPDRWWLSPGYWIASVPSLNLGNDSDGEPIRHAVVMRGPGLIHDPALDERYTCVNLDTDVLAVRWLISTRPQPQEEA